MGTQTVAEGVKLVDQQWMLWFVDTDLFVSPCVKHLSRADGLANKDTPIANQAVDKNIAKYLSSLV